MKALNKSVVWPLVLLVSIGLILAGCAGGDNETANATGNENEGEETLDNENGSNDNGENESSANGEEASGEVIELDFWTFWGSEVRRPIIEQIVEDFNESQDDIHVTHTFSPWGDIWTANLAAIAAGDPPDVIVNAIETVAYRAQEQQNTNLSEFVDADENIEDWFFDEMWETVLHEGDPYALPFTSDTRVLYYNKDAFEEAGLDPEQPPTTWEELDEYAQLLDVQDGDRYSRIGFYPLWGDAGMTLWMSNASGERLVDDDGQVNINLPEHVEALEWVNSYTERLGRETVQAFQAEFSDQQADPFINEIVAMMGHTGTFYTQIREYAPDMNFGVAPIPEKEPGSGHTSQGGGFVVEIPHGAANPEASYEFIRYLADVDAQAYWARMNYDNVANIEGSEQASEHEDLSETDQMMLEAAHDNFFEWTMLAPTPVFAPDFLDHLNPQLEAAELGQNDPQEALDAAQQDVEDLIESNR